MRLKNGLIILFITSVLAFLGLFFLDKYYHYHSLLQAEKQTKSERVISLREYLPGSEMNVPIIDGTEEKKDAREMTSLIINDNGFITLKNEHKNPDLTILFLGGSTTANIHVDNLKRFPSLSGKLLEEKTGLKVNSLNAGFPANHSLHSINTLLNKGLPQSPDLAVFCHNINDLVIQMMYQTYWNNSPTRSLIKSRDLEYKNQESVKKGLFPFLFDRIKPDSKVSMLDEWAEVRGKEQVYPEVFSNSFQKNLQIFIQICKVMEIEPVLMTQPSNFKAHLQMKFDNPDSPVNEEQKEKYKDLYPKLISTFSRFNEIIRDVAKTENVVLIDLEQLFEFTEDFFYDEVHFNYKGSEKAAEIIASVLSDNLE